MSNQRFSNLKKMFTKIAMIVNGSGDNVFAYRGNIWLFDDLYDDLDPDTISSINNELGITDEFLESNGEWETPEELRELIYESRPDILFGNIYDDGRKKTLHIHSLGSFSFDPKTSILVKKVLNQLGLHSASYSGSNDSDEYEVYKGEALGAVPDVVYHGTTTVYLKDIIKAGLRPGVSDSNYADRNIEHPNLVFFTSKLDEAQHHAVHTASRVGGDPLVLKISIPDKNLIVPDYDIDALFEDTVVYDYIPSGTRRPSTKSEKVNIKSPDAASREFGIFGYRGRIPSKFIESYYILPNADESFGKDEFWHESIDSYYEATPEEARIYAETKDNYGYGSFEEPEFDEEDWSLDDRVASIFCLRNIALGLKNKRSSELKRIAKLVIS